MSRFELFPTPPEIIPGMLTTRRTFWHSLNGTAADAFVLSSAEAHDLPTLHGYAVARESSNRTFAQAQFSSLKIDSIGNPEAGILSYSDWHS